MSAVKQQRELGRGFPKSARLLKHRDFEKVYQEGRRYSLPHFAAFYLHRGPNQLTGVRVGFTVGRVLGGAVERNRIRRRLREAVRLSLPFVPQLMADVVLQPRRSALAAEFAELQQQAAEAFAAVAQNRGALAKRKDNDKRKHDGRRRTAGKNTQA